MREDVKKFLFLGLEEDKEAFFQRAQVQGLIHFIDPHQSGHKEIPQDVQRVTAAIKILRGLPPREQEENFSHLNADNIVDHILRLHELNEKLQEDIRVLAIERSRIEVFGDFSFEDIDYIEKKGKCKIQFFCARPNLFAEEPEPENLIFVASEHGLDYYMAINDHPVAYEKMIEMKFEHSLGKIKKMTAAAQKEHYNIDHELIEYEKYNNFLHQALIDKLNRYHLYDAQTYVQQAMGSSLFAVEGWIPANKVDQLQNIIGNLNVYADEIAIEPTDKIPTYLENQGLGRLGEDLVHIYDTPSATDKDPSMWVLGAFALFFAFIISDAGYGLVFLALALFLRYKYPHLKGAAKRVLDLFTVLSVGCIIWGILMTSFFGLQIDIQNPIRKLSLVQWLAEKKVTYHLEHHDSTAREWLEKYPELKGVTDPYVYLSFSPDPNKGPIILNRITDNVMFELALFIGVVHLIISLLRYVRRNWHNIGWVAFLIGAYLYFPYYLKTPSLLNYAAGIPLTVEGQVGFQLMLAGVGVAWVLAIIHYGWVGIFEFMVLIQVFADTLSYLRLYALGLAGAIVASTINEIASGMPLMAGILLILVSHFINIILCIMSGVIHGLRLNFIEWYHYSFEGGGKQFQPLKLLKKE
jgi:V/A-type H+-transporting ATPase subunit I